MSDGSRGYWTDGCPKLVVGALLREQPPESNLRQVSQYHVLTSIPLHRMYLFLSHILREAVIGFRLEI